MKLKTVPPSTVRVNDEDCSFLECGKITQCSEDFSHQCHTPTQCYSTITREFPLLNVCCPPGETMIGCADKEVV